MTLARHSSLVTLHGLSGRSSSGRTHAFGAWNPGSNPGLPARLGFLPIDLTSIKDATMTERNRHSLKVFTGNAPPSLAREICGHLGGNVGEAFVGRFPDGE